MRYVRGGDFRNKERGSMNQAIIISGHHKMQDDLPFLQWGFTIKNPAGAFSFIEHEGTRLALTERNYYFGKKTDQKIHYQHMSTENSSAKFYKDIYVEIDHNLFIAAGICTDTNIEQKIEQIARAEKSITAERRAAFKSTIIMIDNNAPPSIQSILDKLHGALQQGHEGKADADATAEGP